MHSLPHLRHALAGAASPERALINLERFLQAHPNPAPVLAQLADEPHTLELLVTLFACSQHLTDILLRHPAHYGMLADRNSLAQVKSPALLQAEARAAVLPTWQQEGVPAALDALRRFQQRELLRIGMADLGGLLELAAVTAQLSHLADAVIQTALTLVAGETPITGLAVLGVGKLGGSELNYSSDVDLLFLATDGEDESLSQRHHRLAERLIFALTQATAEGFLYRVDMRLRPWGRAGPLVTTMAGYLAYLERFARLWECQALLKARVVAGDVATGSEFLRRVEPLLFSAGPETARAEVYNMKRQTEDHLRRAGRAWGDVKLGEGSIRDAEFVVQYLQLVHGGEHPELRTPNTREALTRLAEAGYLSAEDYRILAEGYTFLRTVEHYLQILDYRQTHTLPTEAADLRYLARRLGFQGEDAAGRLVARYQLHSQAVRGAYLRHLAASAATHHADIGHSAAGGGRKMTAQPFDAGRVVEEHLARLTPAYAAAFDPVEVERHAIMAAQLDPTNPILVDAQPLTEGRWRVTVVGYDYLGVLSAICGLLFAHGFSIVDGQVYTYEPRAGAGKGWPGEAGERKPGSGRADAVAPRKIVDVFQVAPVGGVQADQETWARYKADLLGLVRLLQAHEQRMAQGELAKRVAGAMRADAAGAPALPPVDIEIDNDASPDYTVLRISATDTPGFLYEFTNALALNGIHISQVSVASVGSRVRDVLFVTDTRGHKITAPERQRELRAATALVKHFTHLLPRSPNPEAALLHFHEYLGELFSRPSWPDELASLERPEVLDALARLLGVSEFLWDDFLRMQYENLFPVVRDVQALGQPKRKVELAAELSGLLARAADATARRTALNAFKDREMFRIDMRHILGYIRDFDAFSGELTDLVETVVAATAELVQEELTAVHGTPLGADGRPIPLAVCVLGKCGGFELGYASDIEVMFIYERNGQTDGPRPIGAAEFFDKLVAEFSRAIWARREGIFEIDLDLRPYGRAGSLAVPLEAFRRYFAPGGAAWAYERQALIKLRSVAGDLALGRQVEALRDAFVYHPRSFDVAAMRAMRERQLRHLVTPGTFNAKYSLGGLVDVEYVVQGLQMRHGADNPALRLTNTRAAITALAAHGIISEENAHRLREAHLFLQQLINALRVVRGNSKDLTVPAEGSEEFAFLARRLSYGHDPRRLAAALSDHSAWVQRLATRLLG
ncbi:MAG: glutamine synthetase adenylyltransferase [Anaerolineae bacterium]